jgi:predicted amidophosphoribosyltransferase
VVCRIRNTPSQVRQSASNRHTNVRGAFRARTGVDLRGQAILLVDDVMTTGNTANEAAKALKNTGAASVFVAVLAHSQK